MEWQDSEHGSECMAKDMWTHMSYNDVIPHIYVLECQSPTEKKKESCEYIPQILILLISDPISLFKLKDVSVFVLGSLNVNVLLNL